MDGVLETGYIEDFIEDKPYSPFPTVQNTERPDVVAASLLEGKVAILVDGTPFALIVPLTLMSALNANEDYYERSFVSTAIRWVRFVFVHIALLLPSIYVALVSYQQEMVPTTFLLSIAAAQEATPFPAIVEAFGMEFMFEGLREAGVRLPKAVGSAISIVGALVIGQAAVQAGIVSAPMVIVVATTGIATFTIPRFNVGIAIRLLRFPMLLLAGMFGFYGITIGMLGILVHLTTLRSFGVPYFAPLAPLTAHGLKDVFIRAPWWAMIRRPNTAESTNSVRVPSGQQPSPRRGE
ncbi:spore germination protein [Alicyclobacillus fastidiosus]|uniref:Spore germination protein n=1 Tax=Alicyclobacillus fastidiosus TaxID=392011 RepID=A0ABY6ZP75_9BACL|nr:spore germination protein [Alicyclobacillus fastidiosus]WAH44657.1 spore germination protein [Alicyclobacillus fastidiosus]